MNQSNSDVINKVKDEILMHKEITQCDLYGTCQDFSTNSSSPMTYMVFEIIGAADILQKWKTYLKQHGFMDSRTDVPYDKSVYFLSVEPLELNILCVYIQKKILLDCTNILLNMAQTYHSKMSNIV